MFNQLSFNVLGWQRYYNVMLYHTYGLTPLTNPPTDSTVFNAGFLLKKIQTT